MDDERCLKQLGELSADAPPEEDFPTCDTDSYKLSFDVQLCSSSSGYPDTIEIFTITGTGIPYKETLNHTGSGAYSGDLSFCGPRSSLAGTTWTVRQSDPDVSYICIEAVCCDE